jgi:hypothetical protein
VRSLRLQPNDEHGGGIFLTRPSFYYYFCNHGTQGGLGFAFPTGFCRNKRYERNFFGAYNIYKMIDAVDDFPGLKVSMELDAFAYEEVLKEDPECIELLKEYIKAGKVAVAGGTYSQPFGQDYGWEPNIRQLTYGRHVIKEVTDYDVEAFLVEEQWFHPQLPQLLQLAGFKYASLQSQNSGQVKPMREAMINWVGIDNTKIPTVPANDLLVSCVRQYGDYTAFKEKLARYEHPLFFQWIEIWPPGMDWGASATPFAKGIAQVEEWQGKPVFLEEFFELELPHRELKDIYIPLDESNYVNNWYQNGGWGYDGDRVIIEDKLTEAALLANETVLALASQAGKEPYPEEKLVERWKRFMVLQNHDFSVARNYRAVTEEGLVTEAGYYAVVEYQKLQDECHRETAEVLLAEKEEEKLTLVNTSGVGGKYTVEFTIPLASGEGLELFQDTRSVPYEIRSQDTAKAKGIAVVDLPAVGAATFDVKRGRDLPLALPTTSAPGGAPKIETDEYEISWQEGTWAIDILHKVSGSKVTFKGFTGPIAKQNEHSYLFPALSPAHEKFSFSFNGTVHSPDQISDMEGYVEETGPVSSTLCVRSDLLTLHTTETPVAFAEARVSVNHVTGQITCDSHLYAGVYLGLQCYAHFEHNLPDARYYRDFPLGEEETQIQAIYPNTYIRVAGKDHGFTLVHPGVQRAYVDRCPEGGLIRHLLARDKVFGEYRWTFDLWFGNHKSHESARLAKMKGAHIAQVQGASWFPEDYLTIGHPSLLLSALYRDGDQLLVRLVNYGAVEVDDAHFTLADAFGSAQLTDFEGKVLKDLSIKSQGEKTTINLEEVQPWQVITIRIS